MKYSTLILLGILIALLHLGMTSTPKPPENPLKRELKAMYDECLAIGPRIDGIDCEDIKGIIIKLNYIPRGARG